jgi:hypothetical protein
MMHANVEPTPRSWEERQIEALLERVKQLEERIAVLEGQGRVDTIDTWSGIAFHLKRSERWCRYMAEDARSDPLPVYKIGGLVQMNLQRYGEWLERQKKAGRRLKT